MASVSLNPYLNFNGNARQAMEFYKSVLGGELNMQSFADFGAPASPDTKDQIMHAHLHSDALDLMASDGGDQHQVTFGDNVHLSLMGTDDAKLTDYFNRLSAGGKIEMPLEPQAWGDKFGSFTDKFGVRWMVNISKE
jgi:PhnB protein